LHKSFQLVPLGSLQTGIGNYNLLVRLGGNAFVSGLIIAAPVISIMFFVNVSIGFLAKMVQGINVFYESFTMRIIFGTMASIFFLPLILTTVRIEMEKMIQVFSAFFQGAAI
jgi:flagellar biosynthetic protein FliR